MSSYQKHKSFGFQHTEWGPCAVENFCNMHDDKIHNEGTILKYCIGTIIILVILAIIKWSILG